MKLIKPKAKLIEQAPGLNGIYKQIELAGRTCYKSEDKITDDSAKGFVDRMIKSNHTAMLEHGTVYLSVDSFQNREYADLRDFYSNNPYSRMTTIGDYYIRGAVNIYITTNFRVLVENKRLDDLKYLCKPTEYHEKRYTFKVNTSIGVTREFNRHRVNSIAEQSTRYCNYSKDKFGKEVTFCIPSWLDLEEGSYDWNTYFGDWRWIDITSPIKDQFVANCFYNEKQYLELIKQEWQPQQAREVLPLCTATEAVYTAFESDWKHFFDLRLRGTTGKPHPNMLELAELMHEQLKQKGIEL